MPITSQPIARGTDWWMQAGPYPFDIDCAAKTQGGIFGFFTQTVPGHNHLALFDSPAGDTYGIANCDARLHSNYLASVATCGATNLVDLAPLQSLPYNPAWGALGWLTLEPVGQHDWTSLLLGVSPAQDAAFAGCARAALGNQLTAEYNDYQRAVAQANRDANRMVFEVVGCAAALIGAGLLVRLVGPRCIAAARDAAAKMPSLPPLPAGLTLWNRAPRVQSQGDVPMEVLFVADIAQPLPAMTGTHAVVEASTQGHGDIGLEHDTETDEIREEMEVLAAPKPTLLRRTYDAIKSAPAVLRMAQARL